MFRNFIFPIGRNYLFFIHFFINNFFKFKVMKKKQIKLAVLINFLVLPLFSFAQLTVQETGKIEIGQEQDMSSVAPEKKDTVTTLKLYGTGINGANSRISFGNATSIDDLNVMMPFSF